MIEQHSMSKQKGSQLATRAGITPASSATADKLQAKGKQMVSSLDEATAAAFDATYMRAQVQQHREVLDELRGQLLPAAQNADLSAQLRQTQTMVQHQLDEARRFLSQVGSGDPNPARKPHSRSRTTRVSRSALAGLLRRGLLGSEQRTCHKVRSHVLPFRHALQVQLAAAMLGAAGPDLH